jgi:hypothetical protein
MMNSAFTIINLGHTFIGINENTIYSMPPGGVH